MVFTTTSPGVALSRGGPLRWLTRPSSAEPRPSLAGPLSLEAQAVPAPDLAAQHLDTNLAARAGVGSQPRGKRLRPLVREAKHVTRVQGPLPLVRQLPPRCKEDAPFPPGLEATPPLLHLPAGARLLHTQVVPGECARVGESEVEATYGIPWEPDEFVWGTQPTSWTASRGCSGTPSTGSTLKRQLQWPVIGRLP